MTLCVCARLCLFLCVFLCLCPCAQVWDLKDAGLQAASRVAAASDPLVLLSEISQNFLSLVSSLTRAKVPAGCCPLHSSGCCCCCRQRACVTHDTDGQSMWPLLLAASVPGLSCRGHGSCWRSSSSDDLSPLLSVCHCTTPAQVSDRLRNTVRNNQQYVNPGANFMLLNGMLVEVKNFEIYSECSTACRVGLLKCLQEHECPALLQAAVLPASTCSVQDCMPGLRGGDQYNSVRLCARSGLTCFALACTCRLPRPSAHRAAAAGAAAGAGAEARPCAAAAQAARH